MNYASSFVVQVIISVLTCAFCSIMIIRDNTPDTRAIYLPILTGVTARFLPVFKTPEKKRETTETQLNTMSSRSSDVTLQLPRSPTSNNEQII